MRLQLLQEQLDFLPSEVTTTEEVEAIVAATKEYEALSEAQKAYIEADSSGTVTDSPGSRRRRSTGQATALRWTVIFHGTSSFRYS